MEPKTIDLTPSWGFAASIYIEVLGNPKASEEGKKIAREEILRMADLADWQLSQGIKK